MHWFRAQARRRRRCRRPRTRRARGGERDREGHEASHPREAYDYDDALVTAVLFTCAGQRADVVTAFREAGAVTIAADVNPLAPALYHADKRLAPPRVDDAAYVEFIAAAVAEHGVTLVVPLTDLDQLALARRRAEIDALVLLPEPEVVERTNDKWLAHCFFEEHGIDSPPTWLPEQVPDDLEFQFSSSRAGVSDRGTSTAPPIAASSTSSSATRPPRRWCSASARARSSRSTSSATSRALPQRSAADDDRVERRRVDQGPLDQGLGADRARRPNLGDARDGRAGQHPVLPNGRQSLRGHGRQRPLRRRPRPLGVRRRLSGLALALARGEHPEPRLGSFAKVLS